MANTESDATYCSEVEKKDLPPRRRSKRLSQKLPPSFRSNGDPASQRFAKIHQMLRSDSLGNNWSKHDWLALKLEVDLIKNSLRGISKSRIAFVQKKIDEHLQKLNATTNLNISCKFAVESQNNYKDDRTNGSVKSPNVLAGITTDILTELLPPYQPHNLAGIMKSKPSILLTQANALDLTKKGLMIPENKCAIEDQLSTIRGLNKQNKSPENPTIDLTEIISDKENREIAAPLIEVPPLISNKPIHTSKWLKYLPTQQQPKPLKENQVKPKPSSPVRQKTKSFKQSLIKLYKDSPVSNTTLGKMTKPTICASPTKFKSIPNTTRVRPKRSFTQKNLQDREPIIDISPRKVQSEHIASVSPHFFPEELIQLDLPDLIDDDSEASLPLSLKASFKKIFGTESLNDVLGCEQVVYSLTERHVRRLASALNLKDDALKRTIERIITDDLDANCEIAEDMRSSPSVVECSQSPPHRLFPSQRSQISK